jgi:alpha-galactosidase
MNAATSARCLRVLVFLLLGATPSRAATLVAQAGDASIRHDSQGGTWTISAGGTTLVLGLDESRDYEILQLATQSSRPWTVGALADTWVSVNGTTLPFGRRHAGFVFRDTTTEATGQILRLTATFDLPTAGLRIARHYSVTSGSPTFESWTTYMPLGPAFATLSNLNAFQFTVPAGTVHWLTGLQGDNADVARDGAFTLRETTLAVGDQLELGAQGRSSEQTVPWIAIDGTSEVFYGALMWSGSWTLVVNRSGAGLSLSMGLPPMKATLTNGPIDGPHALFGVVSGGLAQATAALRSYVLQGVRGGGLFAPLVTYNTWFAYGTEIEEATMRAEMERTAALGVELFVVDAGWYVGAGRAGVYDFDAGLGTWQVDLGRFPNGLAALSGYAHSLGMKFGIWVEPERVNFSAVGIGGVAEPWLATVGGQYGSDHAAQICFAGAAAQRWVLDRLTALLDQVQPHYLKWDNNMWINCDRSGHGHGSTDGNFAHVHGLYGVLAELRARYPMLLIENVSGGGNRLDFGMLRYTDVAWMDDRTAPSVHVRHNVEGLSAVFPPAYLLSFVTNHAGEPLHDSPDLQLYFRSRMLAALGLCFRSEDLSESDLVAIGREIRIYKSVRGTLGPAAAELLTTQASVEQGPSWDVLQETSNNYQDVLLSAFQSDDGVGQITIRPTGLSTATTYEVRSADSGVLGTATGSELMTDGIEVRQSRTSAAHLLIITAKP